MTSVGTVRVFGEIENLTRPAHPTDVGWDLRSAEAVRCPVLRLTYVSTKVHVVAPVGLWYRICARSSITKRGIIVPEGVIDPTYSGELFVPLLPVVDDVAIECGERIAQVIFYRQEQPARQDIGQVPIPNDGRGPAGFGSTGRR